MSTRTLRARALLARYAGVVVALALVLASVGGVAAYDAHVGSGTETVERSVDEWRLEGSLQHAATVTAAAEGTPFAPNATVSNRDVYFERVMPVLDGEFVLALDGTGPLRLSIERRVTVASVDPERGGEGTVYWRRNRSVESTTTTLEPGERATTAFAVNVSDAHRDAMNVSERLDSPGDVRLTVVVDVEASRADGAGPNRTLSFAFPIELDDGVYRVEDGSRTGRLNRTTTTTVPAEPGVVQTAGGPLAVLVGLAGAAAVVLGRRRDWFALSQRERRWLTYQRQRAEYADWISAGSVPDAALDAPAVEVDALEELADVAIDTDERVLHDTDRGSYLVLGDDVRYVYDRPTKPDGDAEPDPIDASATDASIDDTSAADASTDDAPADDGVEPTADEDSVAVDVDRILDAATDEVQHDADAPTGPDAGTDASDEQAPDGGASDEQAPDGGGSEGQAPDGGGSDERDREADARAEDGLADVAAFDDDA